MKAKRTSKLKRARTERAKPRSVQRVVGHAHRYCQICGDSDCTGLRHCSPSDPYYERLRDPRDKEIDRLADIIKRATTRFFVDGSDGETAAAMLKILQEASVPNDRTERQPPGEAAACNQTSQETKSADTGKRGGCSLQ